MLLLGGERSPAHLAERLDALTAAIPHAERVTLPGQGHGANLSAPSAVARVVAGFVSRTAQR
ncbi:alpha/beta hydrolase [Dactylosporangium sp. AC04546]|uniref:alpha/beta fold hydrolase n=1 Tax=Dactylosporangium sp. AC04546 TaxID=2862460 RepID=UPI001EDD2842|nr:alpha/beta hydrolase [Dactylosporangium sp. AC04546]WVK85437.1 alpha/beta hydrolase [Dactylosporangium sp. AC04546]